MKGKNGELLCCPVCGLPLKREGSAWICEKRHSFDVAREGYVNLLCSQRSSQKTRGDDRLMVRARREFLERGYYGLLRDELVRLMQEKAPRIWLDAGCGEGYYTSALQGALSASQGVGADISKEAVRLAAKRDTDVIWVVAACHRLPVGDATLEALVNVFAPTAEEEFARVLKKGGWLIRVRPLPDHLWELKQAVYGDRAQPNPPDLPVWEGFHLKEQRACCATTPVLAGEELEALFCMTPYYYTSSAEERARGASLPPMSVRLAFDIQVFERN